MRKNILWLMPFLMALVFTLPMQAFAASYTDISGHWAKEDVTDASGLGIFRGYTDGGFHPEDQMTRAEFVTALVRALNVESNSKASIDFQDVKPGDWFYGNVEKAIQAGFIQNGDYVGAFQPNQAISRGEIARMIARTVAPYANVPAVKKTFKDVQVADPFAPYVEQAAGYGIISGYNDGTFRPDQGATRAEAAVLVVRAMKVMPQQGPYNIQLQGLDNAAGPFFAINQMMSGMRNIFNYDESTDFSTLQQFADSEVVDQLQTAFKQYAGQHKGLMLFPNGSPLLPKFISRTTAVVKQENITFFKRSKDDKAFSDEYAQAENVTWYLKFKDGQWKVVGIDNFKVPNVWIKVSDDGVSFPPTVYYKLEDTLGTFYGSIRMAPGSEKFVMQNIRELMQNASPSKVKIYAIGEKPVEFTPWADEVKQLEANPPAANHGAEYIRLLAYQSGYDEISSVWMLKKEVAAGFYVAFTNTNYVQMIGVDGIPWSKIWGDRLWMDLIKKETMDTVFDNASKYQLEIEKILQGVK